MSKKVVPFTLPSPRQAQPETAPVAGTGDAWVLAAAEEAPEAVKTADDRLVIDLSVPRSWPQLVGLIWAFPFVATMMWTAQFIEMSSPDRR